MTKKERVKKILCEWATSHLAKWFDRRLEVDSVVDKIDEVYKEANKDGQREDREDKIHNL